MISNTRMNPSNMNSNNISVYNDNKHIKSYNCIDRNLQNDWKSLVAGHDKNQYNMAGDPGNNLLFYNFNAGGHPVLQRPGERKYVSESSENGDNQMNSYDLRRDNQTPSRCSL